VSDAAIEIQGLAVRVRRKTLLAIERLLVPAGELLGVLGPNGAGKTTLLRSCLGTQPHAMGHISILGQSIEGLGLVQLARLRQRVGYVPQLLPVRSEMPLTVREVVAIGRTGVAGLLKPLSRQDWRIVDEWIERLGLAPLARQGYGEISGGEQRKALIARAMVQQPAILLLDEPTANLDLGWRERIVQIVEDLYTSMRMTVLLVCHELEVLPPGCSRVAVLRDGCLIADGRPERVLTDELLESMYGPGLSVLHEAGRHAVVPGAVHA
jgi:iron complex transport system ATP-binding protein